MLRLPVNPNVDAPARRHSDDDKSGKNSVMAANLNVVFAAQRSGFASQREQYTVDRVSGMD